jgi:hypothetical protein
MMPAVWTRILMWFLVWASQRPETIQGISLEVLIFVGAMVGMRQFTAVKLLQSGLWQMVWTGMQPNLVFFFVWVVREIHLHEGRVVEDRAGLDMIASSITTLKSMQARIWD